MGLLCFYVIGWLSDLMIVTHVCIKCNHYVILFVRLLRVVESISFNDKIMEQYELVWKGKKIWEIPDEHIFWTKLLAEEM